MGSPYTSVPLLLSFFLVSQLPLNSAKQEPNHHPTCNPSYCGKHTIKFPFSSFHNPECGLQRILCHGDLIPRIQFSDRGRWYEVLDISYEEQKLQVRDYKLIHGLQSHNCTAALYNFTEPVSPLISFRGITANYTFSTCKPDNYLDEIERPYDCESQYIFYWPERYPPPNLPCGRWVVGYPLTKPLPLSQRLEEEDDDDDDLLTWLDIGFALRWLLLEGCRDCHLVKGGLCLPSNTTKEKFTCWVLPPAIASNNGTYKCSKKGSQLAISLAAGFGSFFLACLVFFFYLKCYHNKRLDPFSSSYLSRTFSLNQYSKSDLENGSTLFKTQFFTYKELKEATNNFDPSKELGNGSFGTVYHGKLRDGRFVAVKRFYENNFMRVAQFENEVAILSRLHHRSLVTLYGCSSRHSRELLLVYEFIPNGTVADHLHGHRAQTRSLTWSIRMSIAIETANALAYLHAIEIIHRDVKTNNILLDNSFHVKVADFGLSRLFPTHVTHVTTAPQGTPGYVDPDYHRCYQLTDKSDVYSFGVILIELISSKPAVDITRQRHEINLADMAMNKIHNGALHELVDPNLGFESDCDVRRMICLVGELAFRCLHEEKEMRPSMEEVLEVLRGIWSEDYKVEMTVEVETPMDDIATLKEILFFPSDSVSTAAYSISST